jgi:hypothetical protein
MNFKNVKFGQSLTETRISPDAQPELVVTPTAGTMRINQPFAKVLGVDYYSVNTESKEQAGVRIDFKKTPAGILVHVCEPGEGAKLASPGKKTSGSLVFNHTYTWSLLEGEKGFATHYGIGSKVFGVDESGIISEEMAINAGYIDDEGKYTELAEEAEFGVAGETVAFGVILNEGKKVTSERNIASDDDDEQEDVEDFG